MRRVCQTFVRFGHCGFCAIGQRRALRRAAAAWRAGPSGRIFGTWEGARVVRWMRTRIYRGGRPWCGIWDGELTLKALTLIMGLCRSRVSGVRRGERSAGEDACHFSVIGGPGHARFVASISVIVGTAIWQREACPYLCQVLHKGFATYLAGLQLGQACLCK